MLSRLVTIIALAAVLALATQAARAANLELCVDTDAGFALALAQARSIPVTIELVQGHSYDLAGTVWHDIVDMPTTPTIREGSELLGGYTAGCASRVVNPGNTHIIDSALTGSHASGAFMTGDFLIEGITFNLTNGLRLFGGTASIPMRPRSMIRIRRNSFLNATAGGLYISWLDHNDIYSVIRISENLIASNDDTSRFALFLDAQGGYPRFDLVNNTIYDNSGNGETIGVALENIGGNARFYLYNNIIWGNGQGTADVYANNAYVELNSNIIGSYAGTAPGYENQTLTSDPKLDATYHPIQSPLSPAINSGYSNVPGGLFATDLGGRARVIGRVVDRGAYESTVDSPSTVFVTNANDSGTGSLRDAITTTNGAGGGTILFLMSNTCPHVITLATELPALLHSTTIDGFAQPGASRNTLGNGDDSARCIVLKSGNASVARGLYVNNGASNVIANIRGLAFSGFSGSAIDLRDGAFHQIEGNQFGGSVGATTLAANQTDITLADTDSSTIGGDDPGTRNLIGGATGSGVILTINVLTTQILGNYIGVGWNGGALTDVGNGQQGVSVGGHVILVEGNVIGDNGQAGVQIAGSLAQSNTVKGNYIGTGPDGANLANGIGVWLSGSAGNAPHGNNVDGNTIWLNNAEGIRADYGVDNNFDGNSLSNNGALGIDLGPTGVDTNDDDGGLHPVDLANRGQNYPVLNSAGGDADMARVTGTLTSTPGHYSIEFFSGNGCDPSGHGEGRRFLGRFGVQIDPPAIGDQGTASFFYDLPASAPEFPFSTATRISATASGTQGTSEFSACEPYVLDPLFSNGFE